MKLWQKVDWLILGFLILIFFFGFVVAPTLPDRVPIHWNIRGEVDGWGSKYINLFLMPGVALFVHILMSFLPAIDPLRKNYDQFAKPYQYLKFFLTFFFLYLYAVLIYSSVNSAPLSGNLLFATPFSVVLILIGFVLPKLKRNFFAGIRTPWTLVSDINWQKTHEFGRKIFIACGTISLLASFLGSVASFVILIGSIVLGVIITVIYSYLAYRKEKR